MKVFVGACILVAAIYAWMFISAFRRNPDKGSFFEMDP